MENNIEKKIIYTRNSNLKSFFYFFTIVLNLRLIFVFINFISAYSYPSQLISLILFFGFIFYTPFFFNSLKNKNTFIIFIFLNILSLQSGLGRALYGNSPALVLYFKNMLIPFLTGIIISYLSLKIRLRDNFFILFSTTIVISLYLIYSLSYSDLILNIRGVLISETISGSLFQTIGYYSIIIIMPPWLAIKINSLYSPSKFLNNEKNKLTLIIFFLVFINFICGSKKDLIILLLLLLTNYVDNLKFITQFSFRIKKYLIKNYIVASLTIVSLVYFVNKNKFVYEYFFIRVARSIINRIQVISVIFENQIKETFPFGNPSIMDANVLGTDQQYIHSSIINVLLLCGVIGLCMWLYITFNCLLTSYKIAFSIGLIYTLVVIISIVSTSFDWQLNWFFVGMLSSLSYFLKIKSKSKFIFFKT